MSPSTRFSLKCPPVLGVPMSSESDIGEYSSYKQLQHLGLRVRVRVRVTVRVRVRVRTRVKVRVRTLF